MNKTWTFIGGMLAGIASVFATAAVALKLEELQQTNVILEKDVHGEGEVSQSQDDAVDAEA